MKLTFLASLFSLRIARNARAAALSLALIAGLLAAPASARFTALAAFHSSSNGKSTASPLHAPPAAAPAMQMMTGCARPTFNERANLSAGSSPRSVAVGDFNLDGKPDLATANADSDNVSVLLGNGAGGFGAANNFTAGAQPYSVAVGDFNLDGKPDLAVLNRGSDDVSVLLGNGAGGFGAANSFGVGFGAFSVTVGDFNMDGKPDLAVALYDSIKVSVLLGNGIGGFGTAAFHFVGENPSFVAVGDFNLDGKPDLATANTGSDNVSVLLGNGAGGFGTAASFAVGHFPRSVAVGDFNLDGKSDLATANNSDNDVSVLLGDGSGGFSPANNFGARNGAYSMAVGDFNLDGKPDLATANIFGTNVSVLLGNGMGGFSAPTNFGVENGPFSVAVGDFNLDGKLDLVTANQNSNNVSVLLNACNGTPCSGTSFDAATNFGAGNGPRTVQAGDFNLDGKRDLVVTNFSDAKVSVLLGDGSGGFGPATSFSVGTFPTSVAVDDFNLDGKPDLAVSNANSDNVSVLLGNGSGSFGTATNFGAGEFPYAVTVGDFNRDGSPDLATANPTSDSVLVLLNNCTPNTAPTIAPVVVTRTAGSSAASSQIATASDAQDTVNTLRIQISSGGAFGDSATVNGVTVMLTDQNASAPNVNPDAMGNVFADLATACGAGNATFTLRVTDSGALMANATFTVTVTANTPPVLSYGNQTVVASTTQTFNPASGPSDNGTFGAISSPSITPANGLALTVHPVTGVMAVTSATLAGSYAVSVSVTDNCGAATNATFNVNVTCSAITINPASLPGATVNTAYPQTITASPAGTAYSFALTGGLLPAGLSLNNNGSFSGAPTQSGVFNFRITATGFGSCSGFRDYVLTVGCPTITVNPATLTNGAIGASYNQTISASPAGAYSFSVTSGALPPGLMLNAATGALIGTPTQSGTCNFRIAATANGCVGGRDYSVSISCPGVTLASLASATAGANYSGSVAATPTGTYSYSLIAGSLPSGLTLNPTTGAISGLPTVTGTYNFTIKAQAANGCSGSQSYSLAVACPAITMSSLPAPTLNSPYNQTVTASPSGGSYSFAVTAGVLPTGLSLNAATGVLSGTPMAAGTFNFTITAAGFGGCAGARAYSFSLGDGGCPAITLAELPSGQPGQLYSASTAASPTGSYSYAVTSGSLPPGVTLYGSMGLLFGYPTTAGTYNFTIMATNASNCTGSKQYSVLIGGAALQSLIFGDFDGDRKADLPLWHGQSRTEVWGVSAAPYFDVVTPGDFDGDGKADVVVWRESDGSWYIKSSGNEETLARKYGQAGDKLVTLLARP